MSRRAFLRSMTATAVAGGLLGASRASTAKQADEPTIGYFDPPEGPLSDRLDRPWEMTEDEWTKIIGRVRPGRTLKPERWPQQS